MKDNYLLGLKKGDKLITGLTGDLNIELEPFITLQEYNPKITKAEIVTFESYSQEGTPCPENGGWWRSWFVRDNRLTRIKYKSKLEGKI